MPIATPDEADKLTGALTAEQRDACLRRDHRFLLGRGDPRKAMTEQPWWMVKYGRPVMLLEGLGLVEVIEDVDLQSETVKIRHVKEVNGKKKVEVVSVHRLHQAGVGEAMRHRAKYLPETQKPQSPSKQRRKRRGF